MELCDCKPTIKDGIFVSAHQPRCPFLDYEKELLDTILGLTIGIEAWAADEDGVHPECFDIYQYAKIKVDSHAHMCGANPTPHKVASKQ